MQVVDADFAAGKLGDVQFALAAAFGAALLREGGKPQALAAWFDVGQVELGAALAGGGGETVEPQLAADGPR